MSYLCNLIQQLSIYRKINFMICLYPYNFCASRYEQLNHNHLGQILLIQVQGKSRAACTSQISQLDITSEDNRTRTQFLASYSRLIFKTYLFFLQRSNPLIDIVTNAQYIFKQLTHMAQQWLTEQQLQIIKQLKTIDPEPTFKGLPDLSSISLQRSEQQNPKDQISTDMFFEVDYDEQHAKLRQKLLGYRKKSDQIYKVGELIKQYQNKFSVLMQDKNRLVDLIQSMNGSTSELVEKQKKMIDLSMKMKESLDYYTYNDKFKFDYPCEVACREMFEDILQPVISQLTDGIQYFQQNSTFTQSKRYLSSFQSNRSKVLSFVKSFFIKLFNKQSQFISKNSKLPLNNLIDGLYPKSKIKFISAFVLHFPQFQRQLRQIILGIKQISSEDEIKFLQIKEVEIQQFELTPSNLALIGYLQVNMPEVYDEAVLKFFTYYRTTFHQNLIRNTPKKQAKITDIFNEKLVYMAYIVSSEYAYLNYCCRADLSDGESIRSTITAIARLYIEQLMKLLKDTKNKAPFEICQIITKVKQSFPVFIDRHMAEEYQSYAFGCISQFINSTEQITFIKTLFQSLMKRLLTQMESVCYNSLPKLTLTSSKNQVENQTRQLIQCIPKLRFCEKQAEKYLISVLDCLVKSIKQVNSKIQSRFQCYIWNLQIFTGVRNSLRGVRGNLIRKQLRLEVNHSTNIIERFKSVERNESFLKYAQDIFQVIKTGMPVINELTLDFSKFIQQHCQALQSQFVKDILFIYAKNMIEFLHRLNEAKALAEDQGRDVCQPQAVQTLYSLYLLSLQKYVRDSQLLMKQREAYKISEDSTEIIVSLLTEVYQRMFDLLDKFYVNTSKYVNCTESFKEIHELKLLYKRSW